MMSIARVSWKRVSVLMFTLALALPAGADETNPRDPVEQHFLNVTSDAVAGTFEYRVLVDSQGVIVGLRGYGPNVPPRDFDLAQLRTAAGMVLFQQQGHKIAVAFSRDFHPANGGTFRLSLLRNGLTGQRFDYHVELDRTQGRWMFRVNERTGRRYFANMFLKAHRVVGQIVGVGQVNVW